VSRGPYATGVGNMIGAVLLGLVVLLVGGCACVFWAERGGPRWARVVATVTLSASELLRSSDKKRRWGQNSSSQGDD
jgi:uncharacterized membrane protein YccC